MEGEVSGEIGGGGRRGERRTFMRSRTRARDTGGTAMVCVERVLR